MASFYFYSDIIKCVYQRVCVMRDICYIAAVPWLHRDQRAADQPLHVPLKGGSGGYMDRETRFPTMLWEASIPRLLLCV